MKDTVVIIAAAGASTRMPGMDKVYEMLGGMTVLERTVRAFEHAPSVGKIVVVTRPDRLAFTAGLLADVTVPAEVVIGGADRQTSVRNGLAVSGDLPYVAVHDGARPFVSVELIERTVQTAREKGAAIPVVPVTDTVKQIDPDTGLVSVTPNRSLLRAVQTPQVFRRELYVRAFENAGGSYTDDSQLAEHISAEVQTVEGDPKNVKLTTPEDFELARLRFGRPRVGYGFDAHRLVEDRALVLCGVTVPHTLGLLGHSDADVAVHALMDAILGACALGDIGHLFPDTDERYSGADSVGLLREVIRKARENGFRIANADITVTAQRPKLAPYIGQMRANLAEAMGVDIDAVSVKATTTEKMGYEGRGEGISASAVVMMYGG